MDTELKRPSLWPRKEPGAANVDIEAPGYRPIPFWSWNGLQNKERLRSQLVWLKQAGFGGAIIHPRPGNKVKFLSEEWLELTAYAMAEAKRMGMDIWLYDEDSYPSGFAGGAVLQKHPEFRARGLRFDRYDEWSQIPQAIRERQDGKSYLFAMDDDGTYAKADGDRGKVRYLVFREEEAPDSGKFNGLGYVDLRDKEAVQAFLACVHEVYDARLGASFGSVVKGIFSDEANGFHFLETNRALNWSRKFAEAFIEANGYDLTDDLPCLVEETGDWRKRRYDYYATLNRLFAMHFVEQVEAWCQSKGIWFTGHYWDHMWPELRMTESNMPLYARMGMPGIDCLFRPDTDGMYGTQMGNALMVKELDSVCRQLGKPRAMCELWGGAGWDVALSDLKRMADWLLVNGINFFVPHLIHYSLSGYRKRDWPPSYGPHFEASDELKRLTDYMTETAEAVGASQSMAELAVLHPNGSVWMHRAPHLETAAVREIGDGFRQLVQELCDSGTEFDLVDEDVLREYGAIDGGKLRVGQASYRSLLVPAQVKQMGSATLELLRRFAEAGGELYVMAEISGLRVDGAAAPPEALSFLAAYGAQTFRPAGVCELAVFGATDGRELWVRRLRTESGGLRCLLVNPHGVRRDVKLLFQGRDAAATIAAMEARDIWNSSSSRLQPDVCADGQRSAALSLLPYQSLVVDIAYDARPSLGGIELVDRHEAGGKAPQEDEAGPPVLECLPSAWQISLGGPNVAVLDFCTLAMDGRNYGTLGVQRAQERIGERHGLDYHFHPIHYPRWWTATLHGKNQPRLPGFEASFSFVWEGAPVSELRLVVEHPELYEIAVNGKRLTFDAESWLDPDWRTASIASLIVAGDNRIELRCPEASQQHELEAIYLLGTFGVDNTDPHRPRLTRAVPPAFGDIGDAGCPFYSGWIHYTGRFAYRREWGPYRLDLGEWDGFAVRVSVGGTAVHWTGAPFEGRRISELLADGENELTVSLYTGLRNTLGPLHAKEDPGMASPWLFDPQAGGTFHYSEEHRRKPTGLRQPYRLVADYEER